MTKTILYYLERLGLVFKRGYYRFYFLNCSQYEAVDLDAGLVEVKAGDISSEIIFGWLTVDEAIMLISAPSNRMFLLKEGDEAAATCWVQTQQAELRFIEGFGDLPPGSAYVTHVMVKPNFRGKGAAGKLLGQLAQSLHQDRVEKLLLCIDHRNLAMERIIQKLGFVFYFGIRYSRVLFVRRYFIQNEDSPSPKWRRISRELPSEFRLINITIDGSHGRNTQH